MNAKLKYRSLLTLLLVIFSMGLASAQADGLASDPRFPAGNLLKNPEFEKGAKKWTLTKAAAGDKVRCDGIANDGECAFQFKGTTASEATILRQTYVPAATKSKAAVISFGEAYILSVSGTSCIQVTVTTYFKNANTKPFKASVKECGSGAPGDWHSTGELGVWTSFTEKSVSKIVFQAKHTGIGVWRLDSAGLFMSDK